MALKKEMVVVVVVVGVGSVICYKQKNNQLYIPLTEKYFFYMPYIIGSENFMRQK